MDNNDMHLAWVEDREVSLYSQEVVQNLHQGITKCLTEGVLDLMECELSEVGLVMYMPCSEEDVVTSVHALLEQVLTTEDLESLEWKSCLGKDGGIEEVFKSGE
jgi:hypothetical protein